MELTELEKLELDRLDAVESPASGVPFLLLKGAGQTRQSGGTGTEDFDRAVIAEALSKSAQGVPLPRPGSLDFVRLQGAVSRQQGRDGLPPGALGDGGSIADVARQVAHVQTNLTAGAGRTPLPVGNPREGGDDSERARQMGLRTGNVGTLAYEAACADAGRAMNGRMPMTGPGAYFDPRNPNDRAFFEAEGRDQIRRRAEGDAAKRAENEEALAVLKLRERMRLDPLYGMAVEKAARKAKKKGRRFEDVTEAEIQKERAKLGQGFATVADAIEEARPQPQPAPRSDFVKSLEALVLRS
jgi:hypothetical protein